MVPSLDLSDPQFGNHLCPFESGIRTGCVGIVNIPPRRQRLIVGRILLVAPYFPPFAPVGATRAAHLAGYWAGKGRAVDVIAADNPAFSGLLAPVEADGLTVHHLPYRPGQMPSSTEAAQPGAGPASEARRPGWLKRLYRELQLMPDCYHPYWTGVAARRGTELAKVRGADLIYSSGPPHSAHIAAAAIARRTGLPWVAELRDLWLDQPYDSDMPLPARLLRERLGSRTLAAANGFVTVTKGAAEQTRRRFGRPVTLSYNGFLPDDFPPEAAPPPPLDGERLTILHAGVVYAERRDPGPLFAAMARLPEGEREAVSAIFYHDEGGFVKARAAEHGVERAVEIRPLVARADMLALERRADVVLLCRWNDPRDDAVIPGKTFEYIGARRPVLAIGSEAGEAPDIVRAGPFGLVSNDPAEIAAQLSDWLGKKRASGGRVPDLPPEPARPYTRDVQFARIEDALAAAASYAIMPAARDLHNDLADRFLKKAAEQRELASAD